MSFDFVSEKRRRVKQFEKSLVPMHHRTVQLVKDCCFAIFEERREDFLDSPALKATQQIKKTASVTIGESFDDKLDAGHAEPLGVDGWSDEGWRQDDTSNRFVQFIFLEHHFEMDLPRPMLWPEEARAILQSRSGFFFLGDRGGADSFADTIRTFRPLRKAYVQGDHYSAAEDISFLFFTLWKFPVSSTLYLSTFGGDHSWETGLPLN